MRSKLSINLLSSGLQAISVQLLGGVFFYLISVYTSKNDFGEIGWANAVSAFLITIISCGLEMVVVRRIASSKTSDWAATAYLFHSFLSSVIMAFFLLFFAIFFKNAAHAFYIVLFFFACQAISYIGSPLRQFLNAKEKFAPYGIIAFISNLGKIVLLFVLVARHSITVLNIAIVIAVCALFELAGLFFYIFSVREFAFKMRFKFSAYKKLLKEAMPQYLSVIFDSSLSRIDWILLGFLSTNIATAEYSFAYRAYEIAKLPLIMLAPVILTKYSKLLSNSGLNEQKSDETRRFFVIEIFVAILILLILNILWSPLIDSVTGGKYGSSNSLIFLIISLCLPFHFFINLLWTLCFATRKYKLISQIIMTIAIGNFVFNMILIPLYGGVGAAISYLTAMILECIIFYIFVNKTIIKFSFTPLVFLFIIGIICYIISSLVTSVIFIRLLLALSLYVVLSIIFKQVRKTDLQIVAGYLKK